MDKRKKRIIEKKGWKIGSASDFLELNPEESDYIELKLSLSKKLKERRIKNKMTQEELANLLKSSQSRVAKMEAGDPSVSIDLLVRSLLAVGILRRDLIRI